MVKEHTSETRKDKNPSGEAAGTVKHDELKAKDAQDIYGEEIYRYCCTLLPDKTDAELATDIVFRRLIYEQKQRKAQPDILSRLRSLAENVCRDIKPALEFKEVIYHYCDKLLSDKKDATDARDATIRRFVYQKKKANNILEQLKTFASDICEDIKNIKQFKSGNRDAYDRLFKKYNMRIYKYCYRILYWQVDPQAEAEDVTKSTSLECFENIYVVKDPASFYSYIRKIAYRKCMDIIKRNKKEVPSCDDEEGEFSSTPSSEGNPEEDMINKETAEQVNKALRSLRENYRIAIIHFYYEDMSHKEISELMGCTEGNSKLWVHRGIKKLQEELIS